jgi:hypothetical protein
MIGAAGMLGETLRREAANDRHHREGRDDREDALTAGCAAHVQGRPLYLQAIVWPRDQLV